MVFTRIQHFIPSTKLVFRFLWLALVLLILIPAGASCSSEPELDHPGGDFTLTDHNGERRSLHDFKGKAVLLYFGYTGCPDACPTTLTKIKQVYQSLGEKKAKKIQTVFVTIDPERDSLSKLKNYMNFFEIDAIGLRGSPEEVRKAADLYGVTYEKVEMGSAAGYLMDHSTYTYLIDPSGKLRYRFRHGDSPSHMKSIIQLLLPAFH